MSSLGQAVLDLIANAAGLDKGLNEGKKKVDNSIGGMKNQLTSFGVFMATTMGNLVSNALTSISTAILSTIKNKLQDSMKDFMDYASQVRDTSRSLGVSAEEASRLIQVADDVTVSYETLAMSMKLAQRNGIDPSIEGLAKLADQYLELQPGVERTQFLLDTFGKSGAEMGKLLEQGGDGIRNMSAAIDENMVLTQEALDSARDYEIAIDDLNDSWSAFVYQIAPPLLDVTNSIVNHYRDIITSLKENGYWYTFLHQLSLDDISAKREQADAALRVVEANEEATGTFEESTGAIEDNKGATQEATQAYNDFKDKLNEVSRENQEAERFIRRYADFTEQYAENHKSAVEEQARAREDLAKAEQDGGARAKMAAEEVIAAQKELNEAVKEYGVESSEAAAKRKALDDAMKEAGSKGMAIVGATESLEEAGQAIQDLEAEWHKSTQQMIYDMVLTKVSVDGLTDAEFAAMQDLAVSMGLITKEQADAAKKMMEQATAIANGIAVQEDVMRENTKNAAELKRLEDEKKAAIDGTTDTAVSGANESTQAQVNGANNATQAVQNASQNQAAAMSGVTNATMNEVNAQRVLQSEVNRTTSYYQKLREAAAAAGGASGPAKGGTTGGGGAGGKKRDSGGKGFAGDLYMIGTGAQPELFVPEQNGMFYPNSEWRARMKAALEEMGNMESASIMNGYRKNLSMFGRAGNPAAIQNENRSMQNNINIYNPAPEPASQSVDGTLKKLSYLGVIK